MSNSESSERGPFSPSDFRTRSSGPRPPISIDLNQGESESDAITELFLGEGSAVPSSLPPEPKLRSTSEVQSAWKVVGRADGTDSHVSMSQLLPPFEAIAPASVPVSTPTIEAVVQGHLPVFAAAWVTQYARSRAEELRSAVVLVRVRQGNTSVECVFPSRTPSISMNSSESLSAALSLAAGMGAKYWIIQTDEVNEPDLWQLTHINRITILTGADEAALVACYRALKGIAQTTSNDSDAEIHVAVLGSSPEKAAHAIDRVTRAGDNFLGRKVTGALAAAKIGAGTASSLYRSNTDQSSLRDVVELIAALPLIKHEAPAACVRSEEEHTQQSPSHAEFTGTKAAQSVFSAVEGGTDTPIEHIDPQPIDQDHLPSAAIRPPSLIDMIDDIEAIGITCPHATGVEFGIAPDGRIHLVAHVDGEPNSGHPSNQSRAVEDLFVAASWACSHSRLLLTAHAGIRLDDREHSPILHVVTAKPREARRLLETNIRVHLVLPPLQGDTWTSMELN